MCSSIVGCLQSGGVGKIGKVMEIRGWERDTFVSARSDVFCVCYEFIHSQRSVAEVEWKETKKKNVYRVGHKGKVWIVCCYVCAII